MLNKHAEEATEEKLSQHKCGEMAGSMTCSRQRRCWRRLQGLSGASAIHVLDCWLTRKPYPGLPQAPDHENRLETFNNMVPRAGLEPARPFGLGILSPLCLPFHHRGNCVFARVLRVTPRFRWAWIHFGKHLLPRKTLRNEANRRWMLHERLGGSQHADWLFVRAGGFQCQVKIACTTRP